VLAALSIAAVLTAAAPQQRADDAERWSLELRAVAPHPALALEPLPGADALDCAACHAEIAAEWAETQHAHAWIDPAFREMLATKRRPESCTGCHVPERLLAGDPARFGRKPAPRDEALEPLAHGVSCRSCHEGPDGAMHGPYPVAGPDAVATDGHASAQDDRFAGGSDALCAACHQTTIGPVIGIAKDYRVARLGERGASCVGCHMRPVERPIAADPDAPDRAFPVRAGRSHRLQTPRDPAFLAAGFALSARRDGDAAVLRIANLAGHRVPGLVDRSLTFRVEARDATGAVVATAEHVVDATAHLPLEGAVDVRLDVPAAALRVVGEHRAPGHPGHDAPIVFLEQDLVMP
jgi:hypothetical protein